MSQDPTVLVLLPEPDIAQMLQALLTAQWRGPLDLRHAVDWAAAAPVLASRRPSVIVLGLPDADAALRETLGHLQAFRRVPVVAIGQDGSPDRRRLLEQAGIVTVIDPQDEAFPSLLLTACRLALSPGGAAPDAEIEPAPLESARLLLVGGREADLATVREQLAADGEAPLQLRWQPNPAAAAADLAAAGADLVVLAVPASAGDAAAHLAAVHAAAAPAQVIVIADSHDAAAAIPALRAGRQDYVTRAELCLPGRLRHSVERALERLAWTRTLARQREKLAYRDACLQDLRQMLTDACPAGVFRCDPTGRLLYANAKLRHLAGAPAEGPPDWHWLDFVSAGDLGPVQTAWQQAVRQVQPFQAQWHFRRGADDVWVAGRSQPDTRDGRLLGHVGMIAQIGDIGPLREQFRLAEQALALTRVTRELAHDINNQLTVIVGFAKLLHDELGDGTPLRAMVTRVQTCGERAVTLTRRLSEAQKEGVAETRQLAIDTSRLIGQRRRVLEKLVGHGVDLTFDLAETVWPVLADPDQVDRMIADAIVAAREALSAGSRLHLTCGDVSIAAEADVPIGDYVQIVIAGTPAAATQTHGSTADHPVSLAQNRLADTIGAIGGYLVHAVAETDDRRFWTIYLPRHQTKPQPTTTAQRVAAQAPRPPPAAGQLQILLVEDQENLLELLTTLLTANRYHVTAVTNGAEGLKRIEAADRPPDVLLTDVIMPELDGVQLAQRARRRFPDLKIIYMTGYSSKVSEQIFPLRPTERLVRKPFKTDYLLAVIQDLLESKD